MRVSLRNQYSSFLFNLQNTQSRLMELNMQASSQKRINKPSDDPVGTARVLDYRSSLSAINQYRANIDTATGWLNLADESMLQSSAILTKLKGLAEQGSTGTMTASDREATAYEVRQLFSQLVNLGNTRYEGKSIFGGQKFEQNAFEEGLMVYDEDGKSLGLASGAASRSIVVQFIGNEGDTATVGDAAIPCRYSSDGGKTWTTGSVGTGGVLDMGGVSLQLPKGRVLDLSPETNTNRTTGSWLTVAPTAVYKGDHESQSAVKYTAGGLDVVAEPLGGFERDVDVVVAASGTDLAITVSAQVNGSPETWTTTMPDSRPLLLETPYGAVRLSGTNLVGAEFTVKSGSTGVVKMGSALNAEGRGLFDGDVMVRMENTITIGTGGTINYSYSTDGGGTWLSGHSVSNSTPPNPGDPVKPVELLVPGGKLVLSGRGSEFGLEAGDQFVIHPQTAAHEVEISAGQYVQLNNIGSEVFGGYYEHGSQPAFGDSAGEKNIFVAVGKLVAALENNDQQGCAEALNSLKTSQEHFTTQLASVGARENRLEVADTVLSGLGLNETERMSNIEDVDLASLLTELANQQLSYETVLKSSSMIMKMSLVNYL